MPDYDRLRYDELTSISEFCHQLSDEQWNHESLCTGWRVRDVVSHMTVGYTTPMFSMIGMLAKYRFNVPKGSAAVSAAFGSEHTPAQILAVFDTIPAEQLRKGITRFITAKEGLLDHVVHHQDMRRPLGLARNVPEDRLVAALGVAPRLAGFVGSKKRAAGLHLVATDVDWSHGDGPEVRGPGEAILLALTGRAVALDELGGEGVATLRSRIAA
ncbi:MAG: maleylpyruvate isomerase family mycothiol-dependent enzyme [Actinobacteria bacterium]|nr:maleylpyruvate isomerase family mycothiol-dependent enzyme [Actinomycetota bacterium]